MDLLSAVTLKHVAKKGTLEKQVHVNEAMISLIYAFLNAVVYRVKVGKTSLDLVGLPIAHASYTSVVKSY